MGSVLQSREVCEESSAVMVSVWEVYRSLQAVLGSLGESTVV